MDRSYKEEVPGASASIAEVRAGDCPVEKGSRDVPLRPGLPAGERQGAEEDPRG